MFCPFLAPLQKFPAPTTIETSTPNPTICLILSQSFPTVSNGKTDVSVLEQILDGLQYFISELTWGKEQLESKMENELDWKD